jgi:hypothetical protein
MHAHTQVSLEFTLQNPQRVARLCLINGCHGRTLSNIYQPFFRVPFADVVILTLFRTYSLWWNACIRTYRNPASGRAGWLYRPFNWLYTLMFPGSEACADLYGSPEYIVRYLEDLCCSYLGRHQDMVDI